jgi:MFS family permease
LACGLAQNYTQLLVYRFITGIFIGGAAPLSFTYLAEIAGRRFRGRTGPENDDQISGTIRFAE